MSERPVRLQRRRTKGFRLDLANPNGLPIFCVTRTGLFGNPFSPAWFAMEAREYNPQAAVELFAHWYQGHNSTDFQERLVLLWDSMEILRGCNLACFCPLSSPCHADVLLRESNK